MNHNLKDAKTDEVLTTSGTYLHPKLVLPSDNVATRPSIKQKRRTKQEKKILQILEKQVAETREKVQQVKKQDDEGKLGSVLVDPVSKDVKVGRGKGRGNHKKTSLPAHVGFSQSDV